MNVNFINNTLSRNWKKYHLDGVRWWLLRNYTDLCQNLFIKSIVVSREKKSVRKMSYDWDKIFEIAEEAGYLDEYVDTYRSIHFVVLQDFVDSFLNEFKKNDILPFDMLFKPEEMKFLKMKQNDPKPD